MVAIEDAEEIALEDEACTVERIDPRVRPVIVNAAQQLVLHRVNELVLRDRTVVIGIELIKDIFTVEVETAACCVVAHPLNDFVRVIAREPLHFLLVNRPRSIGIREIKELRAVVEWRGDR